MVPEGGPNEPTSLAKPLCTRRSTKTSAVMSVPRVVLFQLTSQENNGVALCVKTNEVDKHSNNFSSLWQKRAHLTYRLLSVALFPSGPPMSAFEICHVLLTSLPPLKNCKAPLTPSSHCKPRLRVLPRGLYVRRVKRCFRTNSLPAAKAFMQPIQLLDFYSIISKGAYFEPFSESARNCS